MWVLGTLCGSSIREASTLNAYLPLKKITFKLLNRKILAVLHVISCQVIVGKCFLLGQSASLFPQLFPLLDKSLEVLAPPPLFWVVCAVPFVR